MDEGDETSGPDEQAEVWHRRYDEARRAGLEHLEAIRFARSNSDVGELRKLVASGCPVEQIRKIVL